MASRKRAPDHPPRRRRNTGSIAAQADGTYWAIPPRWVDAGRKPRRGFTTWGEAGRWLDDACQRARNGDTLPSDITLEEYGAIWYDRMADSADWSPGTRASVRTKLRMMAAAADAKGRPLNLHERALSAIVPGHAQDVIASLVRRGVSPAVIGQIASILRRILASAQEDGLVARNVASRLVLPKVRRRPAQAWTHAEVRRLIVAIEGEPLEPLVWLGLVLGLRIGEILGLAWDDIDVTSDTLTVRQSYSAGQIGPPKTRRERTVRIPPKVWAVLLRHHEAQELGTRWVFPGRKPEKPLSYDAARRWLIGMLAKAEVRVLPTHTLRHSAATAMLANGVLPSNAAQQLGHANPGVTLSTYWSPTEGERDPSDVVAGWLDQPDG